MDTLSAVSMEVENTHEGPPEAVATLQAHLAEVIQSLQHLQKHIVESKETFEELQTKFKCLSEQLNVQQDRADKVNQAHIKSLMEAGQGGDYVKASDILTQMLTHKYVASEQEPREVEKFETDITMKEWQVLSIYDELSADDGTVGSKLYLVNPKRTILCSHKREEKYGRGCLSTSAEEPAQYFEKLHWALTPLKSNESGTYMITNAEFGGMLYVSDYTFESSGQPMKGVYAGEIGEKEEGERRHIWRIETTGVDKCRVISIFNNQVLCESCVMANSKEDFWVAVADENTVAPCSFTFSMQSIRGNR